MKRCPIILLCLLALLGCDATVSPEPAPNEPEPENASAMASFLEPASIMATEPPDDPDDPPEAGQTLYMVHLRIGTIEVPTGMASGSERLWSYLDEEPMAMYSAVLGLNGFRIGLGRAASWESFAAELQRMTARRFRTQAVQLFSYRPGEVTIKESQPVQTIFTYHDDQTLTGADYPPGDNILTLAATVDRTNPEDVLLTALPQIRTKRKQSEFVLEDGVPTLATRAILEPFRPLTVQLRIPKDHFVVIGPGIMSRRPTSVAHHFLTFERQGMEYETLLILHPQVVPLTYRPPVAR
jgi:hypothetical protein